MSDKIKKISAREILDSRGNPTVEATVWLEDATTGTAKVPSGASTGTHEAVELRDGDKSRYGGKGVLKAISNIETEIADALIGMSTTDQRAVDDLMRKVDGTENKSRLGGNAILAVSMAATRAAAKHTGMELYEYIGTLFGHSKDQLILPTPMINVLNGGKHAIKSSDFQEYMIMPVGAPSLTEAVRWGSEIFHTLADVIKQMGFSTTVGDEGGFAPALGENDDDPPFIIHTMHDPSLTSNEEAIALLDQVIRKAGYKIGEDVVIAIDSAASEFLENGKYHLKTEDRNVTSGDLLDIYEDWVNKYPIRLIEDPFAEDDWDAHVAMMKRMGDRVQIVGDDLLVTNVKRLAKAIELEACNSILIKLNQIGTVSESIDAIKMAQDAGMKAVVSHRSGETEDTFIADFVVGSGVGQIKTGSMSRSERVAKYNRLMKIEQQLSH